MGCQPQKIVLFGYLLVISMLMAGCSVVTPQTMAASIESASPSAIEEPTIIYTLSATETLRPTATPTHFPTNTPTITPIPTEVLTPTPVASFTPLPSHTSVPTKMPTPTTNFESVKYGDCIPITTKREIGIVKSITDGDTIVVTIDGIDYKVRYIGVDSPEPSSESLGISASNANKNLVLGKEVVLIKDVSEVDRYDMLLRYVVVGNTFVNEYLVRLGVAKAVSYDPDTTCNSTFVRAQSVAVDNKLGLWSSTSPAIGFGIAAPLTTLSSPCNCSIDYDCADFTTHAAAQACFSACGGSTSYNWSALDRDRNGSACESLP